MKSRLLMIGLLTAMVSPVYAAKTHGKNKSAEIKKNDRKSRNPTKNKNLLTRAEKKQLWKEQIKEEADGLIHEEPEANVDVWYYEESSEEGVHANESSSSVEFFEILTDGDGGVLYFTDPDLYNSYLGF